MIIQGLSKKSENNRHSAESQEAGKRGPPILTDQGCDQDKICARHQYNVGDDGIVIIRNCTLLH